MLLFIQKTLYLLRFRISLSKGKSIITVRDELEHVRNYLMIQQTRFKNKFIYRFEAGEEPPRSH